MKTRNLASLVSILITVLLALTAVGVASAQQEQPNHFLDTNGATVIFVVEFENGRGDLSITGPKKFALNRQFLGGEKPYFDNVDPTGKELPDGRYSWQVSYTSPIDPELQGQIVKARLEANEEFVCDLVDTGVIRTFTYSGSFMKVNGKFILPSNDEEKAMEMAEGIHRSPAEKAAPVGLGNGASRAAEKDFVINDDLIVDGSACIGFDCVNGESFGFDTIRLKENNLRIKFDDTSVAASFPRNDWQLTANDSANGGASKFSIDDISGNRTPFTVEANARSHSLYVDDGGRIGIRTSTPSTEIHVIDGDTPTLRLQQDGSSGFAPQTWDVAGNETNFFIRDVSNGSTLPLRIRPGAPTSAIDIANTGHVGIGTASPDAKFVVSGVDDGTMAVSMDFANTSTGSTWFFQNDQDTSFKISLEGSGGAEVTINDRLDGNAAGDATLEVDGSIEATNVAFVSARDKKTAFNAIDTGAVLDRLAGLEVQEWRYKTEPEHIRHMGPIAEDFAAAFGLGASDKHITVTDVNGVTLAALQALYQRVQSLEAQLAEQSCEQE